MGEYVSCRSGSDTGLNRMKKAPLLHEGHRKRLRARYERAGLLDFADHEILELLLFDYLPRVNTNPIAHRLLNRFGTLDKVFAASEAELCEIEGIGPKTAKRLAGGRNNRIMDMLKECDFSKPGFRFSVLAEMHMRYASAGVVTLFSPDTVIDYTPSEEEGALCDRISRDASVLGTDFLIVVKTDEKGVSDVLKRELVRGGFGAVYCLQDKELEPIPLALLDLEP